ncbi:hypothetical protein BOX15_Mlig022001g1 [Macrostomum lignano]|uniref:Uncharacterized protein n=1 Tax=Macrostomum lignano TaxID=282301 RepID=A0A267EXP8_9PLAT|nr:hypothetical protein BOX15_Mlig022001g1 [Macrostomum lignano]
MSFSALTETKKPLNSKLLAPSFPRKKAVDGTHQPNTYRVLFEDAYYARPRDSQPLKEHQDHLTPVYPKPPANRAPRPKRDLRHHNPCPWNASHLRENVATMLVPVCHVTTEATKDDQYCWWINDPGKVSHNRPNYSFDSTSRDAFRTWQSSDAGRGASFRQKFTDAANGIVPVNPLWEKSGQRRVWSEKISYEQQYNSRHPDIYPPRGRRQGALVLNRVAPDHPDAATDFLASRGIPRDKAEADAADAAIRAEAELRHQQPQAPKERSELPFRPPNFVPYHRQFVLPDRAGRDTVASLVQPEFRYAWNQPQPEPYFTA